MALAVGSKVAPFSFSDQSGREWTAPESFPGEQSAIFFLRHLGCPLCKAKVEELIQAHPRFTDKKVQLIVVVQSTPKRVTEYAAKSDLRFHLVPDREKRLYQIFQVPSGSLMQYAAPAAFMATVRATLKGHMHGKFEGDEFQLPAMFLLSPEGVIELAHYGQNVADFGDVAEILAKVK